LAEIDVAIKKLERVLGIERKEEVFQAAEFITSILEEIKNIINAIPSFKYEEKK
jgi:hypothetical protein